MTKAYDLVAKCTETAAEYTITEQFIRENVYRVITNGKETSMSHEEFWNLYDASGAVAVVKKNNLSHTMTLPRIVDGDTSVGIYSWRAQSYRCRWFSICCNCNSEEQAGFF